MTELLLQQANHDELTGLYNRRAFAAALQGHIETFSLAEKHILLFLISISSKLSMTHAVMVKEIGYSLKSRE